MSEDAPQFTGPEVEQHERQPDRPEVQEVAGELGGTAVSETETQTINTAETHGFSTAGSSDPEEVNQAKANYELHKKTAAELARETNYYEVCKRNIEELRELSEKTERAFMFRHIRDEEKESAEIVDAFKQLIDERITQETLKSFDARDRLDEAQKAYDTAIATAKTHFEEKQNSYQSQASQEVAEKEKDEVVNKATELAERNQKLMELGDPKIKSLKVDVTGMVRDTEWGRYLRGEEEKMTATINSRPMRYGEDKWNWIHLEGHIERPGEDTSSSKFTMLELQVNEDGTYRNSPSYDDQGELPEPGTPEFTSLNGVLDTLSQAYDKVESQLVTNS